MVRLTSALILLALQHFFLSSLPASLRLELLSWPTFPIYLPHPHTTIETARNVPNSKEMEVRLLNLDVSAASALASILYPKNEMSHEARVEAFYAIHPRSQQ